MQPVAPVARLIGQNVRQDETRMRLYSLMVAAILAVPPLAAQEARPSPADAEASSRVDTAESGTDSAAGLPVSVDRIRDALAAPRPKALLREMDAPADFALTVEERVILEDFFRPEDFRTGPVPPGGLYAHEQQRVLSNSVDRPLQQPYAAFSSGELVTLAIQGLLFRYLGQEVVDQAIAAGRAADEAAARETVMQAIQRYCAAQPAGGAAIEICSAPPR
jgi:hypothetical protein